MNGGTNDRATGAGAAPGLPASEGATMGAAIPDSILDAVRQQVRADFEEQLETTRALLRIPSVTGSEGEAQAFMADLYRRAGLETHVREVPFARIRDHPAYCGLDETAEAYGERPNVIATAAGTGGGRSLLLNGHVDVVSPEPVEQWRHDPWGAELSGGRLYGRGANDMKSGLIANLFAVRCLRKLNLPLRGDLLLQSVIEEEAGGGGGTLALFLEDSLADAVVITEPTDLGVRIGSGGVLYFRIRVEGRTAHAGNAHLGINAIGRLIPIYRALERLDEERGSQEAPLFAQGSYGRSCHVNLGVLRAGDWPSTVPGSAVLEGRIGFLPGETAAAVRRQLTTAVREACRGDPWLVEHPPRIEWFGFRADPWLEPDDSPLVPLVRAAASRVVGEDVGIHARASAVDNRFAAMLGRPTVCLGTRGVGNHGIDEYVEVDSLEPLTTSLALIVLAWCGRGERESPC